MNSVGETSRELDPLQNLHHAIVLTQRKMRRIRLLLPSELSAVESIILSHLAYDPTRTATDLVNLLSISKTKISRLLAALVASGCLTMSATESDKRSRRLSFTAQGERLLQEADQLNSRISQFGCALLSPREHLRMVELFRRLNNGLGSPPERLRAGESPFAPEQRRAVIALGMIGDSYLGTTYNLQQYQLLLELWRAETGTRFHQLTEQLPISTTKISRMLTRFEQQKLVAKLTRSVDKRSKEYCLTELGQTAFNEVEQTALAQMRRATEDFKPSEVQELTSLLGLIDRATLPKPEESGFHIATVETEDERSRARTFLVEQLVRRNAHHNLDQYLLPDTSLCCIGTWNEEVLSLVELRPPLKGVAPDRMIELKHIAVGEQFRDETQVAKTLDDSLSMLFERHSLDHIFVPETATAQISPLLSSTRLTFTPQRAPKAPGVVIRATS